MTQDPLGTFGDDFAGPALGFGCFSGQTEEDRRHEGPAAPSWAITRTRRQSRSCSISSNVSFETNEILTSETAEEEIRAGIAKKAAENDETHRHGRRRRSRERASKGRRRPKNAPLVVLRKKPNSRQSKRRTEEGMAAHQAAVEQYQKALADN